MITSPSVDDLLTIERTYCGPPDSAHGGTAVGRFAQLVDHDLVEVRLLAPPPLETPLEWRAEPDGAVTVSGPDGDIARVRALGEPLVIAPFRRVGEAEVEAAAQEYLRRFDADGHGFSTCFACGPDRHDPDALRQYTGRTADGDTVARFRVDGEGPVPDWLTLAGLDCPSGGTVFALVEPPPAAAVLGLMQCHLLAPAERGVDYQVRGRLVAQEGRKLFAEVAMLAPSGDTVAEARAVWVSVDPEAFGVSP